MHDNTKAKTHLGVIEDKTHMGIFKAETHLVLIMFGYLAFLVDYLAGANTIITSGRPDQVIGALLKTGSRGTQANIMGAK